MYHSCALLSSGSIRCWGDNSYGKLGNNSIISSSVPVTVSGITTATAIAVGQNHSCALLSSGSIQCWGDNSYGKLGNNSTINSSVPVTVSGITTATAIALGYDHSCALLADGSLQCWGKNFGALLGRGSNISLTSGLFPAPVVGLTVNPATKLLLSISMNYSLNSIYKPFVCTQINIVGVTSSGSFSSPFATDTTINLSSVGDPGLSYYSDSNCSNLTSSLIISAATNSGKVYVNNPIYNNYSVCGTAPISTLTAQSQDGSLSSSEPLYVQFEQTGGCGGGGGD
jgi:hypothetical protein